MANLTLAMKDETLAQLRVYAAERRTTVNALFRKYADDLLAESDRSRKARQWMVEKGRENMKRDEERAAARARGEQIEESTWRWNREDCYTGRRFEWPRQS
jgi:hypothetical protein